MLEYVKHLEYFPHINSAVATDGKLQNCKQLTPNVNRIYKLLFISQEMGTSGLRGSFYTDLFIILGVYIHNCPE